MVLNDENLHPTERMHEKDVIRLWRSSSIKGKREDFFVKITNIQILSAHGKVNYNFDETKD